MIPGLGGKDQPSRGSLIPGTITQVTPTVLVLVDGATTPIQVKVGLDWASPAIGNRVGLIQIGTNYLALSTG